MAHVVFARPERLFRAVVAQRMVHGAARYLEDVHALGVTTALSVSETSGIFPAFP